jgi:hypothetical protein
MSTYQRRRDELSSAMYELTCQRGALEPPRSQMIALEALRGNQLDIDRYVGVIGENRPHRVLPRSGRLPPAEPAWSERARNLFRQI